MSHRCPDCRVSLRSTLAPSDIWIDGHRTRVEVWYCPNADNHGKTVECENCGEQVPSPEYHATWVDGLYGSRRWTCFRPLAPRCYQPAVEQPVYKPDPPGRRTIRAPGTIMCNKLLPCPDHEGTA